MATPERPDWLFISGITFAISSNVALDVAIALYVFTH